MADDDLKTDAVYEVVSEMTMRKSEDKQSEQVQKLQPKTFILVVEQGATNQALVRDLSGTQGWVEIANDEGLLVRAPISKTDTRALWKAATSEVQKAKEKGATTADSPAADPALAKELKECKETLQKCQDEVKTLQKKVKESENEATKQAAAAKSASEEAQRSAEALKKSEEALSKASASSSAASSARDTELERQRALLETELSQASSYRREASSAVDAALAARERFDREESEAQAAVRRAKLIASAESTSAGSGPVRPPAATEDSGGHLTKERLRSEEQDLALDQEELKLQRETFELEKNALAAELRSASDEHRSLEKERQDVKVEQQSCAKQASEARVAAEEALAACVATAEERNELEETVQRVSEELERGEERAAKGSVTWQLIKALESDAADAARTAIQEMEASRRYQGIAEEASRERLELKSERDQLRKELRDLSRLSRFAPVLRPTR